MDAPPPAVRRMVDGEAVITFDDRYAPVIVATWVGSPTVAVVGQAQVWLDHAYAEARAARMGGLVVISDATQTQLPSVEARRRLLELRHDPELMLKVIAVMPVRNTLVYGVLSALVRVLDSRFAVASSFTQALELAARAFVQRGLPIPDSLEQLRLERRE